MRQIILVKNICQCLYLQQIVFKTINPMNNKLFNINDFCCPSPPLNAENVDYGTILKSEFARLGSEIFSNYKIFNIVVPAADN